jgi:hypothetical protein
LALQIRRKRNRDGSLCSDALKSPPRIMVCDCVYFMMISLMTSRAS